MSLNSLMLFIMKKKKNYILFSWVASVINGHRMVNWYDWNLCCNT